MTNKPVSRRDFFKQGLRELTKGVKETASILYAVEEPIVPNPSIIRPPGALPEAEFLEKCTRCNECVKICPEESIMKFVGETSPLHLTPMLSMRKSACILCEGFPCIDVCEPQALVKPKSRQAVQMGTAVIDQKLCYAWQGGHDCDYCFKECPIGEKALYADVARRPHVNVEHCTGCGLCEYICPSRQAAIRVERISGQLKGNIS